MSLDQFELIDYRSKRLHDAFNQLTSNYNHIIKEGYLQIKAEVFNKQIDELIHKLHFFRDQVFTGNDQAFTLDEEGIKVLETSQALISPYRKVFSLLEPEKFYEMIKRRKDFNVNDRSELEYME